MNLTNYSPGPVHEYVEESIVYWVAAILCPILLIVGVGGNLYASCVLIAQSGVQKTPAILTIITIGVPQIELNVIDYYILYRGQS